jgi:hypothetical protein
LAVGIVVSVVCFLGCATNAILGNDNPVQPPVVPGPRVPFELPFLRLFGRVNWRMTMSAVLMYALLKNGVLQPWVQQVTGRG